MPMLSRRNAAALAAALGLSALLAAAIAGRGARAGW